ncbi:MAG: hypothetical protein ACK524_05820 [Planctomyces sp.]
MLSLPAGVRACPADEILREAATLLVRVAGMQSVASVLDLPVR